ncbi:hypothetical protein GC101_27585 [Paenibacillus sp. LMG 31459]|uniref:Uncharacterized protein n=1 Tax=Paenibacillus phytohabitans TaxID=2654978 RepID=A0ABX1YNJ3_9BACL|nr:hypothetical protein [Paenibacillus phytohabitans]NOU82630.1 hypothetical protein [Paenibacillus phytohabitans]
MFHFWKENLFERLKSEGYLVLEAPGGSPGYVIKYFYESAIRINNLKEIFEADRPGSSTLILPKVA